MRAPDPAAYLGEDPVAPGDPGVPVGADEAVLHVHHHERPRLRAGLRHCHALLRRAAPSTTGRTSESTRPAPASHG